MTQGVGVPVFTEMTERSSENARKSYFKILLKIFPSSVLTGNSIVTYLCSILNP